MGRFTQRRPSPSRSDEVQDSDQSHSHSSSLSSQPSLPSVPSLTPPLDLSTSPAAAAAINHQCIATFKGHSSYIFSLALAGKHLYSGASDGEVRVWDRNPSSYTQISDNHAVSERGSAVKSAVVLGEKLFTAHNDYKIRVWKIDEAGESKKYAAIAVLPTMSDRCMSLLSAKNYVKVRRNKHSTWVHHVDAVSALAATADGAHLYSASWDRSFKIWRTSDFKCVESVQDAHDDAINAVVLSPDGHVYTGSADRKIKVWKMDGDDRSRKHALVSTLEKHRSAVNALALSGDGNVLYSGACDRSIIVWEKDGGDAHMAVAGALRGHTKAILCLAVAGEVLCSGSADRSVRVWRREIERERGSGSSYSCLAVMEGHKNPVKCLAAAFDSKDSDGFCLVYSGSLDSDIKVWKIRLPFT